MRDAKSDFRVMLMNILPFDEYPLSESLGIEYLNAILRNAGYQSQALVRRVSEINGKTIPELFNGVRLAGFTMYSETAEPLFSIAKELKKLPDPPHVVAGGPLAFFHAEDILRDCGHIDSAVKGEGYDAILSLAEALRMHEPLDNCVNLFFRRNGIITTSPMADSLRPMDTLPFATRTLLQENRGALAATMVTQMGCPGVCRFCTEASIYRAMTKSIPPEDVKTARIMSPKRVVDEMEWAWKTTGFDSFEIDDSSFEGSGSEGKNRLWDISMEIIKRRLPIYFMCNFRAESFSGNDDELMGKLGDAGLSLVFIGVESGHDQALKYFNKRARRAHNMASIEYFRRMGLNVETGFIMFHARTTFDELRDNLSFLLDAGYTWDADIYSTDLALFPGMPIIESLNKERLIAPQYSYSRPYEWMFADHRVGRLMDYLRRKRPLAGNSFAVSHPLLELDTLMAKLRKDRALESLAVEFSIKIKSVKNGYGEILADWFHQIAHAAEADASEHELAGITSDCKGRIAEASFHRIIRVIISDIEKAIVAAGRGYVKRQAPWGDVIYPLRMFTE